MVLIASRKTAECRAWRKTLQGMCAIREVGDRGTLERNLISLKPAMLLLDSALPKLGGVGAVRAIQQLSLTTKIVVLTSTTDEKEAIAALKAGARGYCNMNIDRDLLRKAVEVVQKGEIWVERKLVTRLLEEIAFVAEDRWKHSPAKLERGLNPLTPRQREIAQLVGSGASNKEIAARLEVTERTVKAHLTAIFRKVGLPDRLRLALFVAK